MLGRGVWPGQSCGAKAGTVADCIGNIGYITWLNHLVKNNWLKLLNSHGNQYIIEKIKSFRIRTLKTLTTFGKIVYM
jgi:hypothetical protein